MRDSSSAFFFENSSSDKIFFSRRAASFSIAAKTSRSSPEADGAAAAVGVLGAATSVAGETSGKSATRTKPCWLVKVSD